MKRGYESNRIYRVRCDSGVMGWRYLKQKLIQKICLFKEITMKNKTIQFSITVDPTDTYVVGRNGVTKLQGLDVMELGDRTTVSLNPIGKRGILNAGFSIPKDDMDRLCKTWLKERGMM